MLTDVQSILDVSSVYFSKVMSQHILLEINLEGDYLTG